MKTALKLIEDERKRQIEKEGWTAEHDDSHRCGQLAKAAAMYAWPDKTLKEISISPRNLDVTMFDPWPWSQKWDKRDKHGRIRCLQIAGALIVAEI